MSHDKGLSQESVSSMASYSTTRLVTVECMSMVDAYLATWVPVVVLVIVSLGKLLWKLFCNLLIGHAFTNTLKQTM